MELFASGVGGLQFQIAVLQFTHCFDCNAATIGRGLYVRLATNGRGFIKHIVTISTMNLKETLAKCESMALARLGGALYLVIIVIGLVGEVVIRGRVVVPGDVAATAANLQAHAMLWRVGIAAEFVLLICAIVLALVFYLLLMPVSRPLAQLAVFFNLVTIAIEAVAALFFAAALHPLGSATWLDAFPSEQRHALASLAVRMHTSGFGAALIFFGVECVILGYLIFRSGFLPRMLGVLMQIAGACYLVNCFAQFLVPSLASRLFPAILLPAFVGEVSLCLWLLLKGVDAQKWRSRALQAPPAIASNP